MNPLFPSPVLLSQLHFVWVLPLKVNLGEARNW
jgi:hypothetical protein